MSHAAHALVRLVVLASAVAAAGAPDSTAAEPPVLRLAWTDPADAAGVCGPAAREEVVRMFKAVDVAAQWRRAEPEELNREDEVRIVLLDRVSTDPLGRPILGVTAVHDGKGRCVWVQVPAVRMSLGSSPCHPTLPLTDQRRLGVALGRVIAHEVVHALAPDVPHLQGLMASRFTRRDLTGPTPAFPAEATLALRAALAGGARGSAPAGEVSAVVAAGASRGPDPGR